MEQASFELLDLDSSCSADLFTNAQPPWSQEEIDFLLPSAEEYIFPTPPSSLRSPSTTQPMTPTPVKKFRIHARNLFLTYPQCDVDPTVVLERIKLWSDTTVPVEWAIVGQEHHKDGALHLHCCIHLKRKRNFHTPGCFDFLTLKHGNYQACRNLKHVVKWATFPYVLFV